MLKTEILRTILGKSHVEVTEAHPPIVRLYVASLEYYLSRLITYKMVDKLANLVTLVGGEPAFLPVDQNAAYQRED